MLIGKEMISETNFWIAPFKKRFYINKNLM